MPHILTFQKVLTYITGVLGCRGNKTDVIQNEWQPDKYCMKVHNTQSLGLKVYTLIRVKIYPTCLKRF